MFFAGSPFKIKMFNFKDVCGIMKKIKYEVIFMKRLVAYFSASGVTSKTAEQLAELAWMKLKN